MTKSPHKWAEGSRHTSLYLVHINAIHAVGGGSSSRKLVDKETWYWFTAVLTFQCCVSPSPAMANVPANSKATSPVWRTLATSRLSFRFNIRKVKLHKRAIMLNCMAKALILCL